MNLNIHVMIPTSQANGPGKRAVIWLQGCTLACPGCFNPETHPHSGGERLSVEAVFDWLKEQRGVEGVTISGGEPLQQRRGLENLLGRVKKETGLSSLVFSGYRWEEIQRMREVDGLLAMIDVLIAGRYDVRQRLASGLVGSANKTIHFLSKRYSPDDLASIPEAEAIITSSGEVYLSGIDPIHFSQAEQ